MALINGELQARTWQQRQQNTADERAQAIARNRDYYEGRQPLPLAVDPNKPDDNVVVNLCRPIIDKGLSLLFSKELTWQIDETATTTTGAEQYLADVWSANDKMALLHEVGQFGAWGGIAAIKVDPQPGGLPDLIPIDPANLTLFCSPHNVKDIWRYRIQYTVADEWGRECCCRQDIERLGERGSHWQIANYEAKGYMRDMGEAAFKAVGEPVAWPFALPPIVTAHNLPCAGSMYGYADLEDTRLQDALNLIASATRKILRLHAHPITIGKGVSGQLLRRDGGALWEIDAEADVFNLEMQSDLASSRAFYELLRQALYSQARMPDLSQVGNLGALTNFGLRVLFADALERTATKQMTYGGLIVRLNKLLCLIANKGDNVTTTLTWPDPLPTNPAELLDAAAKEQSLGLTSDETLATMIGRDYADELARLTDERERRKAEQAGPTLSAEEVTARVTAAGILIRSGFEPAGSLLAVGLDPIKHMGLLPVTLQQDKPPVVDVSADGTTSSRPSDAPAPVAPPAASSGRPAPTVPEQPSDRAGKLLQGMNE